MQRQPDPLSAASLIRATSGYAREVCGSLWLAVRRWQMDDGASMAAAVAYYLALSLFPMVLLLTSGLGLVLKYTRLGQDAELHILAIVAEHCSPTLELQVRTVLKQFEEQSMVGGPFGLAAAVLAAVGVFCQFERAFDKIWRIPNPPTAGIITMAVRVLSQRLAAFMLLSSVGLAIIAILFANVALSGVREWMTQMDAAGIVLIVVLDAVATMSLNAVAVGLIYRWLPKRPVSWRDALRGGLLVSLIWEAGRQVLSVFLVGMRYTTAYGVIGSFIALLLWFYWGVTILFFGAQYVQVLSRRRSRPYSMFQNKSENSAAADGKRQVVRRLSTDEASPPRLLKWPVRPTESGRKRSAA